METRELTEEYNKFLDKFEKAMLEDNTFEMYQLAKHAKPEYFEGLSKKLLVELITVLLQERVLAEKRLEQRIFQLEHMVEELVNGKYDEGDR